MKRIEVNLQTGERKEIEVTPEEAAKAKEHYEKNPPVTTTHLDKMLADPVQRAKLKALLADG